MRRLAQSRGISSAEIMAIGDNYNDLEMLEFVGQPVVMANAAPGLVEIARSRGWQLTASNDDDGVALAIESVLDSLSVQSAEAGIL